MIKADYLIIISILLFFSCHTITNYLVWHIGGVAKQIGSAEEVALQFEANPLARIILDIKNFNIVYTLVIMPGIVGGAYYAVRRHLLKKGEVDSVNAFAVTILVMAASNFLNDLSILLGVFI